MSTTKIPLNLVSVASPCTASWDSMSGDDTTRFCGQCARYVYNLSEMTQAEAEATILEYEGKLCVRYFKRADGTLMTRDCPVGWRAIKRRAVLVGGAAAAIVIAAFSLLTFGAMAASIRGNGRGGVEMVNPVARLWNAMFGGPQIEQGGIAPPRGVVPPAGPPQMVLGEMCPLPDVRPVEMDPVAPK